MPDGQSVTAARGGRELIRQRVSGHHQTFPDHASYIRYSVGANYVRSRAVAPPILSPKTTIPDAPTAVIAVAGNAHAAISFTAPANNGGEPITAYTVTSSPGGFTATGASSPLTVTGLVNGTAYTFTVIATNGVGSSLPSAVSTAVTPFGVPTAGIPNAPTNLLVNPSLSDVTISFTPGSDNGSPITNYEYSTDNGATFIRPSTATGAVSTITITGLIASSTYNITLKAVNAMGSSTASETVTVVLSLPGTPILQYALADDSAAYLYFTPGSGGTVANYQYSLDSGAFLDFSPTTSPIKISSLTNGLAYSVVIRAVNNAGFANSNTLTVTPTAPSVKSPWLYVDPSVSASYSGTGTTVNTMGDYGVLTGTKAASVTYDSSIKGGIFNFPGTNGAVISFPSFNFGSTISVTAWIYPRLKSDINGLLTNAVANVAPTGFKFQWNSWLTNNRRISFQAGNSLVGNDDSTVQDIVQYNTWQHVGYVFDKTNQKILFFLNGIPVTVATDITTVDNINTNAAFNIGGYIGGSYTMNAQLGYIKVFNTLLDATQVYADYNNSKVRFL